MKIAFHQISCPKHNWNYKQNNDSNTLKYEIVTFQHRSAQRQTPLFPFYQVLTYKCNFFIIVMAMEVFLNIVSNYQYIYSCEPIHLII